MVTREANYNCKQTIDVCMLPRVYLYSWEQGETCRQQKVAQCYCFDGNVPLETASNKRARKI